MSVTSSWPGDHAEAYVAARDVAALLNRVGECVRALPSYGRTRTRAADVLAKRMLSAISTCSPERLTADDSLRAVLVRVAATRRASDGPGLSGAERIAAARWMHHAVAEVPGSDTASAGELPSYGYVLCEGHVIRRSRDDPAADATSEDAYIACEDLIHDLALAGALLASEIDRLQQLQVRRHA